jgi:hypothetical protein
VQGTAVLAMLEFSGCRWATSTEMSPSFDLPEGSTLNHTQMWSRNALMLGGGRWGNLAERRYELWKCNFFLFSPTTMRSSSMRQAGTTGPDVLIHFWVSIVQ